MAFTPAGGVEEPPPATPQTAGELPVTGRQQNLAQHVHQVQSTSRPTSHNNPPEIQIVSGTIGNTSKSITSSTSHSISDRHKKVSKTTKKSKARSRLLSAHRSESETYILATSGTSFQSIPSSSTHPSSDRFEKSTKTEKKIKPRSRSSSPTRSATEAATLTIGNGVELQPSPTNHQPISDLLPSPSGTPVNEQQQPKLCYDAITSAARVQGLAGAAEAAGVCAHGLTGAAATAGVCAHGHVGVADVAGAAEAAAYELEPLPAVTPSAVKLCFDVVTTAASVPGLSGAAAVAGSAYGHAGAVDAAGTAETAATINRAEPSSSVSTSILAAAAAAAAGAKLLPGSSTPTHEPALHPSVHPAVSNKAKGKEKLQLRPALTNKTSQNPNPITPTQTRIDDPNTLPETHAQQPPQTQAQTRLFTQTQIQTQLTQTPDPLAQTQIQTHNPSTQNQTQTHQPKAQHPAHNSTPNFNQTQTFAETSLNPSKISYASIITPTPTSNPNGPPHPQKSFSDVVSGQKDSSIPLKPVSLMQGEPAVIFSTEEIAAMAEPFKLTLIGKFSFGRPPMDIIRKFFISLGLKGTSQISLLDNRHILIKLSLEEDYSRIWVRQSWYVNGRGMRIFKWSKDFRCSAESPIVPVWVSLPYLPVHFIYCKAALYSIAAAIGTPLRVDNATASGNRPSVARILVEYDISQPLLPRIWIGEGDSGFWQDVFFEKVPAYCSSCRHLGHSSESCYIANPGLRKAPQPSPPSQRPAADKSEQPTPSADEHPRQVPTTQSTVISDFQPLEVMGISSHPLHHEGMSTASDMPQDAHVDDICPLRPPALRDIPHAPDMTPEPSSLAIQIVDSGSPITMIFPVEVDAPGAATAPDSSDIPPGDHDTTVVGFNTHCTDFPSSEETGDDGETGDGVQTRDGTENRVGEEISDVAIIENFGDQRIIRCSEGFIEVTPRKNFKFKQRRRRQYC